VCSADSKQRRHKNVQRQRPRLRFFPLLLLLYCTLNIYIRLLQLYCLNYCTHYTPYIHCPAGARARVLIFSGRYQLLLFSVRPRTNRTHPHSLWPFLFLSHSLSSSIPFCIRIYSLYACAYIVLTVFQSLGLSLSISLSLSPPLSISSLWHPINWYCIMRVCMCGDSKAKTFSLLFCVCSPQRWNTRPR
jgi:hypothetical protein